MQDNAAVYRTQETLAEGKKLIDETVQTFLRDVKVEDKSLIWNTDLIETLELRNLLGMHLLYLRLFFLMLVENKYLVVRISRIMLLCDINTMRIKCYCVVHHYGRSSEFSCRTYAITP